MDNDKSVGVHRENIEGSRRNSMCRGPAAAKSRKYCTNAKTSSIIGVWNYSTVMKVLRQIRARADRTKGLSPSHELSGHFSQEDFKTGVETMLIMNGDGMCELLCKEKCYKASLINSVRGS